MAQPVGVTPTNPNRRRVTTAVGVYTVTCKGVGGGPLVSGGGRWGPGGHVQVTAYGSEEADDYALATA